jgi:hypothetical protein
MSLLDNIRFLDSGLPPAGAFIRSYGYSWAYLCKMPRAFSGVVEMSVIVYRGRPLDSDATLRETAYSATFDTTNNTIIVTWPAGQASPELTRDNWVLDATMSQTLANGSVVADPRGYFYRVLSTDQLSATSMAIEVQQPLRSPAGASPGVLVIMDGVIGVFERGAY